MSEKPIPENARELADVAQKIVTAIHSIVGPVRKRILSTVLLVEVADEVDLPAGTWPGNAMSAVALGSHCIVGNIPPAWLPTVLRHIADHEDKGAVTWDGYMKPKPGAES